MDLSASILTGDMIKRERQWRRVSKYLHRYEKNIGKEIPVPFHGRIVNPKVKVDKTIWICWLQGMEYAPQVVCRCIESVKKNKPEDFDIVCLSEKNIKEYVLFPEYIQKKISDGTIGHTHFSDLLRTELLYQYGGLWIDATVFCAKKIPRYMCSGKLFAFRWSLLDCSVVSISSWWLYAVCGQSVISDTRDMLYGYWKREKKLRDYYLFHIMFSMAKDRNEWNRNAFSEMVYANNSAPHVLFAKLEHKYDEKEWKIIRDNMPIQKLSYRKRIIQGDIYNYYTALMDREL